MERAFKRNDPVLLPDYTTGKISAFGQALGNIYPGLDPRNSVFTYFVNGKWFREDELQRLSDYNEHGKVYNPLKEELQKWEAIYDLTLSQLEMYTYLPIKKRKEAGIQSVIKRLQKTKLVSAKRLADLRNILSL